MRTRLQSLDAFRGLTVAAMLLVNNPGSWAHIYPPLEHAAWHGWTPTDLIFPFFLFIVGITTHLAREGRRAAGASESDLRRRMWRRGLLIILAGWLLAAFPFWPLTRLTGLRLPGVLPRIGVTYIATELLTRRGTLRRQVLVVVGLLFGYWAAMTLLPVPGQPGLGLDHLDDPSATLAAWLDRALLDGHLWKQSRTWDPEGILSTIPAIGTAMLGTFAGRWLATDHPLEVRVNGLFGAGAIATWLGLMWGWSFPINKSLWTSSYALFTAGMAALVLATIVWLVDLQGRTRWARPFLPFGVNPLLAFLGSGLMAKLMGSLVTVEIAGELVPVQAVVYRTGFASWLAPRDASLAFAVAFVVVWWALLAPLARRGVILKA